MRKREGERKREEREKERVRERERTRVREGAYYTTSVVAYAVAASSSAHSGVSAGSPSAEEGASHP